MINNSLINYNHNFSFIDYEGYFNLGISNFKVGNTILDFGCKDFRLFDKVKNKKDYNLIGWDINPLSSKIAKIKDYKFINPIKIKSNSINVITFFEVLEHLNYNEFKTIFTNFNRILKDKGLIIITTPNPKCLENVFRFWNTIDHIKPYGKEAIIGFFKDNNYELVKYKLTDEVLNPLKVLRNFLLGLSKYTTQYLIFKKEVRK